MKCPICQQECVTTESVGRTPSVSVSCPIKIRTGEFYTVSHYRIYQTDSWDMGKYYLERAIALPYKIESHHNANITPYSVIYVMGPNPKDSPHAKNVKFNYALTTPLIHMDIEEKLRQRVKLILLLS